MTFLDSIEKGIHSSWSPFFTPEIELLLKSIEAAIEADGRAFTPERSLVLRLFSLDLNQSKVIILGQDPYPQKGRATGRAFEVGGLTSWQSPFENASLRNIVRAIFKASTGEVRLFTEIRGLLSDSLFEERFEILPPNELFKSWENQGVLLLNSAFTCALDVPASHSTLWYPFTQELLRYINVANPNLIWFIWGAHAQKSVKNIPIIHKIETAHPMLASPKPNDMLLGRVNPFYETKELINWRL